MEGGKPAGRKQSKSLTLQRFSSVRGLEMAMVAEPGAGQSKLLKAMKQAARAEAQNNDVSTSFDKLFDSEVGWRKTKLMEEANAEKKGMQLDPSAKRFGYHSADLEDTTRPTGDNLVNNADFLKVDTTPADAQILELLHDSPVFHKRLKGLDEFMGQLHTKFTKLEKSASTFVEADRATVPLADSLADSLKGFTTTLRAFHDSGEDPDAGLDVWTSSWGTLVQEMQLLRTVLDSLLQSGFQDPLHELFRNETKEARNAVKKFHAARAKYAQALQRYLAMGKDTDAKVMKTVETKLAALKNSVVEFARVAMARLLSVERRRKIECLERMNDFMYLHLSYFRHGYKLMQQYDEPMRQLRVAIQSSHRQIGQHNNAAVGKFEELRQQVDTKHEISANSVTAAQGASIHREGYLLLRDFKNSVLNPVRREWKRRFFVVENGTFYYRRNAGNDAKTKGVIDLKLATVRIPRVQKRFCFELVSRSPDVAYLLQAENEQDKLEWIHAIQATTANLLGLSVPGVNDGGGGGEMPGMAVIKIAEGNEVCADCGQSDPEWASINTGITLCLQCSGVHRSLGVHITKVRSLAMDEWPASRLELMKQVGNTLFNRVYEGVLSEENRALRPVPSSDRATRDAYIRAKYVDKKYFKSDATPAEMIELCAGEATVSSVEKVLALSAGQAGGNTSNGVKPLDTAREADGRTALHMAAGAGNMYAAELLLENGASIKIADAEGNTPLHMAAAHPSCKDMVELLVRMKADVNHLNAKGQSAADLAAASHEPEERAEWVELCGGDAETMAQPLKRFSGFGLGSKRKTSGGGRKASTTSLGAAPPPPPPPPKTAVVEDPEVEIAVALYVYEAQRADELSLQEGDEIIVTKKDASGWWEGLLHGKKGLFPGNYVDTQLEHSDDDYDDEDEVDEVDDA
jgi:Arf-GAP/coiled-coil/ANK repeat/PH domain-containing protein